MEYVSLREGKGRDERTAQYSIVDVDVVAKAGGQIKFNSVDATGGPKFAHFPKARQLPLQRWVSFFVIRL